MTPPHDPAAVGFDVYGMSGCVTVPSPDLVRRVVSLLPIHATSREPRPDDRQFAIETDADGNHVVVDGREVVNRQTTLEGALFMLNRHLAYVAIGNARDHLLVSAGVVGVGGRAIVLPGPTRIGKTQLVAALLRAGATYYTDDYAVFDEQGRARPYPSRLLMRGGEGRKTPESLGAERGEDLIPVAVIALVRFAPDGAWSVRRRTPAEGALMLLQAAYGLEDPSAMLPISRRAAGRAIVLEGERGEADEAAAALLEIAAQSSPDEPS